MLGRNLSIVEYSTDNLVNNQKNLQSSKSIEFLENFQIVQICAIKWSAVI